MMLVKPMKVPVKAIVQKILNIIILGLGNGRERLSSFLLSILLVFGFTNLSILKRAINCDVNMLKNIAVNVIQLLLIAMIGIACDPA